MAGKNTAGLGIYPIYSSVEAVDALKAAGFRNTDISGLFPENGGTKDFAHEKGTKAPEEATAGGRHLNMSSQQGKVGWAILWLLGVPIPILLLLFLMRGCT